jgi:outer membrane protein
MVCGAEVSPTEVLSRPELNPLEIGENYDLLRCVQQAVSRNPDLLKSREEIERSQGVVVEARAGILPRVVLSGGVNSTAEELVNRGFTLQANQTTWDSSVVVRQTLYAGGALVNSISAATLEQQAVLYDFQSSLDQVTFLVTQRYYDVLLNRALVEVQQQSIKLLSQGLEKQKRYLEVGKVNKFNVMRAEVELANAKPKLIRAQNQYRTAMLDLARLISLSSLGPGQDIPQFNVVGELQHQPYVFSLDQALAAAREHRPEIKSADARVQVAQKRIRVAAAGYQPQISAYGGYQFQSDRYKDPATGETDLGKYFDGWTFGVQGEWNVFDGFLTKARVDQTKANSRASVINSDQVRRNVEVEVRQGFFRWNEATELIASQEKNVGQAEETLRQANARFEAGLGTQLDILNAQVALTEARSNQFQARYDYLLSRAILERVTGLPMDRIPGAALLADAPLAPSAPQAVPVSAPVPVVVPSE